ncbi:MAG: hypothetical protein U1F43_13365 [Myxococcota bacterium]
MLVLSMHDEDLYADRALGAGANGYVMKRAPIERFFDAIDKVLAGGIYASDQAWPGAPPRASPRRRRTGLSA